MISLGSVVNILENKSIKGIGCLLLISMNMDCHFDQERRKNDQTGTKARVMYLSLSIDLVQQSIWWKRNREDGSLRLKILSLQLIEHISSTDLQVQWGSF